jgi:hypothetical protein
LISTFGARAPGITGVVASYVPGHGGDVWFVRHDNTLDVGAYIFTELEPINSDALLKEVVEAWRESVAKWQVNHELIPTSFLPLALVMDKVIASTK